MISLRKKIDNFFRRLILQIAIIPIQGGHSPENLGILGKVREIREKLSKSGIN